MLTDSNRFWVDAMNLIGKDDEKAEKLLLKSLVINKNNPIDLHFTYNQLIKLYYRKRNIEGFLEKCIDCCKKDISLYPDFKRASMDEELYNLKKSQKLYKELNDVDRFKEFESRLIDFRWTPPRIPSFQQLAIIYEKQGNFIEAIEVCELAINFELDDNTKGGFPGRIEKLLKKINNPPTSTKLPYSKTIESNELIKTNTCELVNNYDKKLTDNYMITFSKSTSNNFNRAIALARNSDHYIESEDSNGQLIYQATYAPENHLNFIALYELVGNWKSAFVFKNGEMVDRKVVGQINYCFGDKLRSNYKSFCFGASSFTENPFGCHRLMIHTGQKPWYMWIRFEDKHCVYIDKTAIREQIESKAATFTLCPAFNYENILSVLEELPDKISKQSDFYKKMYQGSFKEVFTIEADVTTNDVAIKKKPSGKTMISKLLKLTGLKK